MLHARFDIECVGVCFDVDDDIDVNVDDGGVDALALCFVQSCCRTRFLFPFVFPFLTVNARVHVFMLDFVDVCNSRAS